MSGIRHQLKMLGSALMGRKPKESKRKCLTEKEIQDLRTAFELLDRNQDGLVTANELQFMLRNMGINVRDELIDEIIKQASRQTGSMEESEFLQWITRIQAVINEHDSASTSNTTKNSSVDDNDDATQDLIAAFRVFDRDGNGFITRDELHTAMEMMQETVTEAQVNEMLQLADLDKDGKINYEEFARLLL